MRNPFMFHICYSLCIYRFYLVCKNKLCIEIIYKHLDLHTSVFMSARKSLGFWRFSDFGISDKEYSTCI
jgi:hypothetical protein